MGLDVASVTLQFLEKPDGAAYDFAWELAEESAAWGEGNAFTFYLKDELQQRAEAYIEQRVVDTTGRREILDWIESLPFDAGDYITLNFNW